MLAPSFHSKTLPVPVIKTVASQKKGIEELLEAMTTVLEHKKYSDRHSWLLAEKAFYLIQRKRMKMIDKGELQKKIEAEGKDFNLYTFINQYG